MEPIYITTQDDEVVVVNAIDDTVKFNSDAEWVEGTCSGVIGCLEYPASALAYRTVREIVRSKLGDGNTRTVLEVNLGKFEYDNVTKTYRVSFSAEYEYNTDARNEADWASYMADIRVRY